ncbi:hypothetical protein Rsub_12999 [Raphidocelis subcapitata]|uniref:Glutamine amidotransferase domain-containing protein n=1 Tax=Raphidocelis subcapitata TaxID=307507 RepID=A0A2V0PMG1_9CHLO|nr:hypothetical protein Rsub_12999 [Raphidocelis subcapitata]|eukprot:GBG00273.1 hypothetical protein Rsub_12999 [Raphidocelis subcapitata]
MAPRRVAVIECEDADKWKDMTLQLWRRILERQGDDFTVFHAHARDLPSVEAAAGFDAIVIGGSHYSVYEDHQWIRELKARVPQYLEAGAKIVGCCFGCQLLAEALGGRVGPNPSGRFVLGVERVSPAPGLSEFPAFERAVERALDRQAAADAAAGFADPLAPRAPASAAGERGGEGAAAAAAGAAAAVAEEGGAAAPCGVAPCFRVMESHGDQVLELPPGAARLASSGTAANEMWCLGDRVLAFQFHIEFDGPIAMEKIHPALTDNGRLSPAESAASWGQLTSGHERPGTVAEVVEHFFRHGITGGGGGEDDDGGGGGDGADGAKVDAEAAAAAEAAASPPPPAPRASRASGAASGATSPTAASERSAPPGGAGISAGGGGGAGSVASSAAPFSFLARQRRAQAHEELLAEHASDLVASASDGFDARMRAAGCDVELLAGANGAAAEEYARAADIAEALARFASDLSGRQSGASEAVALAPQILAGLGGLAASVAALDGATKALERRVAAMAREAGVAAGAVAAAASAGAARGRGGGGGGGAGGSGGEPKAPAGGSHAAPAPGLTASVAAGASAAYKLVVGSFASGGGGSFTGAASGGGASTGTGAPAAAES